MPKAGVYSGGPYLNTHFTAAEQAEWRDRRLWIAGYPDYWPPYGWERGAAHTLHQFTNKAQLPGMTKLCDMSRANPAALWPSGGTPMPVTYDVQPNGPMHGTHSEQATQAGRVRRDYKAKGIPLGPMTSIENPGRCVEAKGIDPNTLTICRFMLDPEREAGNNADTWTPAQIAAYAHDAIQLIFDHTNDQEYQAVDFFIVGCNEWNPDGKKTGHPELVDWTSLGNIWTAVCLEASNRSPEMERLGLHPIRLGLPCMAQGVPEYWQMQQVLRTGLGGLMKQRRDLAIFHEGPFTNQPWTTGLGQVIPGALICPPGGGSGTGRCLYWYQLGLRVPFVVSECYDGLDKFHPVTQRYAILDAIDRNYRVHSQWYRGVCWYELIDGDQGPWQHTDFTPTFDWTGMQDDVFAKRNEINGGSDMTEVTDADLAAIGSHSTAITTLVSKYRHVWKVGDIAIAIVAPLTTYNAPNGTVHDKRQDPDGTPVDYDLNVAEVSADNLWLRVAPPPGTAPLWVKTVEVKPKV